ncbi:TIGR03546 family protein [Treponema sp. Marseille-Q4130]|uniref:TIGR03546 family protein n=1 Tax=Treponema sp. Marseille-Q4130 TaxID=2766702 RepID=UPI001651E20B|nr:TIGR03546 family protein [Treponema sp. Marseille-Q4130]MBC6718965.1 TIGR03546 family protein [Treponema sp. Marseille-Q4130]
MIGYIVKLFRALNSNSKPSEIANALCLGLILGFMPKNNLLWYLLVVLFLFVRINKGAYLIAMALGALAAPLLDPLFDRMGYAVLTFAPLEPVFSYLLDVPFVGFTRFNNTIVCGSLLFGIVCYVPLFIIAIVLIKQWRTVIAGAIKNSKIGKAISALPIISKIAEKASELV